MTQMGREMFDKHLQSFAHYASWAYGRLYGAAATLPEAALVQERPAAFFTSIIGTLNHLLLVDRIWLGRAEEKPPFDFQLDEVIHGDLVSLSAAQEVECERAIHLTESLEGEDAMRPVRYETSQGKAYEMPIGHILAHLFNHQTHHRGQAHALLTEAGASVPSLDYMVYLRQSF